MKPLILHRQKNSLSGTDPETQDRLWKKLQQISQYVASPGCEVWISGTRYNPFDAYAKILDKDAPLLENIVPGNIHMGCYEEDETGKWKPLNFFRFCVKREEESKRVKFRGVMFTPVRESLQRKKETTNPISEWYAQMENNPISGENQTFNAKQFSHILPVKALNLQEWLRDKTHVTNWLTRGRGERAATRGTLDIAILGDIAYSTKKSSDYSVLLAVAQDIHDHWYLLRGWRRRSGYRGLTEYFRQAYAWRDEFRARLFAIETHAKESTILVAESIAIELGVNAPNFHPLKDNSYQNKTRRVTAALEPLLAAGRLHICQDFPKDILAQLIVEAEQFPLSKHDDTIDSLANGRQAFRVRRSSKQKYDMAPWREKLPANIGRFLA